MEREIGNKGIQEEQEDCRETGKYEEVKFLKWEIGQKGNWGKDILVEGKWAERGT